MKYFAMIDGERRGPYELNELADAGVRPSTYVWCKEMDNWEKAEDVADVCRMFRNRLHDLMHPDDTCTDISVQPALTSAAEEERPSSPTRFDRHLRQADAPELPSLEEIESRQNRIPPSPLLIPLAILVTIFFFPPTGAVAIFYSFKARKAWKEAPESKEAGDLLRAAKMWTGITFFLGLIVLAFMMRTF